MKGHKRVRVQFFGIDPFNPGDDWHGFPAEQVLDEINALDREAGKGYLRHNLFDEVMCLVLGKPPHRMLIAYVIDRLNPPRGELKGVVEPLPMKPGQGIAKPAYVMFFPNDVLGIIRPTIDCPGSAAIATYISEFGGVQVSCSAIPTPDALKKLQRDPSEIIRLRIRIKTRNVKLVVDDAKDLADAIRVSANLSGSTEVGLTLAAEKRKDRPAWWQRQRPIIDQVARSGDAFEHAVLDLSGHEFVNLLEERITTTQWVALGPGQKQLDEDEAAKALVRAYAEQESAILEALSGRSMIRGPGTGTDQGTPPPRLLGDSPAD